MIIYMGFKHQWDANTIAKCWLVDYHYGDKEGYHEDIVGYSCGYNEDVMG